MCVLLFLNSREKAVAGIGSVNPTRLPCGNEPDGDNLWLDSAFVSTMCTWSPPPQQTPAPPFEKREKWGWSH
jgi:hypothetical protein